MVKKESFCSDTLTNEETAAVNTYRQMIEWLSSLPDEDYDRQMLLPISANLTAFRHFQLRQRHLNVLPGYAMFAYGNDHSLLVGT